MAILPPLAALALQWLLWPITQPSIWFLLYPAIFFSSWLGGLRVSAVASAICALVVMWAFIPPRYTFVIPTGQYVAAAVFFATGVAFGLFHDRLRRASRQAVETLAATERTNAALRQAMTERRIFAALIENSSDFIGIADPTGKPLYVNPAGRRIVGLAPDQPVERTTIVEYYAEDQRGFAAEVIVKSMEEHGSWRGETSFRNWRTGEAIPVSDTHFMIRDPETGDLLGMGTVTRDISDLKRARDDAEAARRELQRANQALASLVEHAPDGIFVADLSGRYTDVNEAGCRMLGYTREEIIGNAIPNLIPAEEAGRLEEEKRRLFQGGSVVSEWKLRCKDGTYLPVEVSAAMLPDGRWQGFVRDIRERKRFEAEQALLSEMGSVLASTLDLGATLTSLGRLMTRSFADVCIVYAMEEGGAVRQLDVALREPGQEWIRDVLARQPVDRSRAPEIWTELEANRSVLIQELSPEVRESSAESEEELRAVRALDVRSMIVSPLYAHGRLVGAMSLLSRSPTQIFGPADVSFAEQVAQRAALAIDNAQLYGAAQDAIQSRADVLGVVAHDLRNPLGAILVQSGVIRRIDGDDSSRITRAAESIGRSADRMNRLIQDLLDVMRLEEGRLSIHRGPVAVRPILADAVAAQEALASAASLDLELDVSEELPDVWADRDRLLQILENLIGNAIKFTGPGGIVRVGAALREGEVLFRVEDSGTGIAAENLPHIFDRFWQAERRERRGAGLGLPIVKGLVEAQGGRVWVESTVDHGSTFLFTLPTMPRLPDELAGGAVP